MIYNRFFNYCESLGTTPLREFNENIYESWINVSSDNESQISHLKTEKCPTNILKKFKKHESVNLIRLKQTAKRNTLPEDRNEKTAEMIKKAEREFAMDLPMLVEETAQDTKIDAIIALETGNRDGIFYPYRPHREHLETRFGLPHSYPRSNETDDYHHATQRTCINKQDGQVCGGFLVAGHPP